MVDVNSALDRIRPLVAALPGRWPLAGGSITLVSRDGVVAEHVFGHADAAGRVPVAPHHLFEIGSISKAFTGLLVLQAVEQGRLDLDAAVTQYLPWLQVRSEYGTITLRHLLHHTAGLVKGADDPPDAYGQAWQLRETETGAAPGAMFHYSNLGYILLGLVLKAVTGTELTELCRTRLLAPLGMTATLPWVSNADRPRLAQGTMPAADDRPWCPGDALAPATWLEVYSGDGNIASNGADMARFLRCLLNEGVLDGRAVLSPWLFAQFTQSLAVGGEDWISCLGDLGLTSSRYGLGINVEVIRGRRCLTHGGGMIGYSSFVIADLDAGIGVVALSNGNGDYPIGQVLARVAHELICAPQRSLPPLDLQSVPERDPALLGRFTGVDAAGVPHEIAVTQAGDGLALDYRGQSGTLYRTWSSRFATDHPALRRFPLTPVPEGQGAWSWGEIVFRRSALPAIAAPMEPAQEELAAYVGRYRSYSPWYPTFRIVLREGRLFLIASGGVEAPTEDVELVPLAPGRFRLGADPQMPERLTLGAMIDGRAVILYRDGCRYSRIALD
jgi:CubicO group peptidase (beta-lactamase class C family)